MLAQAKATIFALHPDCGGISYLQATCTAPMHEASKALKVASGRWVRTKLNELGHGHLQLLGAHILLRHFLITNVRLGTLASLALPGTAAAAHTPLPA